MKIRLGEVTLNRDIHSRINSSRKAVKTYIESLKAEGAPTNINA
jgi:biotin operon repressor